MNKKKLLILATLIGSLEFSCWGAAAEPQEVKNKVGTLAAGLRSAVLNRDIKSAERYLQRAKFTYNGIDYDKRQEIIENPGIKSKSILELADHNMKKMLLANLVLTDDEKANAINKQLLHAAKSNNIDTLTQILQEKNANIDATDINGKTALMYAAKVLNVEAVRLLLDHGADPRPTNRNNQTALELAQNQRSFTQDRIRAQHEIETMLAEWEPLGG